jgi:hypothetical protein
MSASSKEDRLNTVRVLEAKRQKLREQDDKRIAAAKQTGAFSVEAYGTDEYLQKVVQSSDPVNANHLKVLVFGSLAVNVVPLDEAREVEKEWRYSVKAAEEGLVDVSPDELERWRGHLKFATTFVDLLTLALGTKA